MLKRFQFPSFEKWQMADCSTTQKVGDYYAKIAIMSKGINDNHTDLYVAAISTHPNPLQLGHPAVCKKLQYYHDRSVIDADENLAHWYLETCMALNEQFVEYMRKTYEY